MKKFVYLSALCFGCFACSGDDTPDVDTPPVDSITATTDTLETADPTIDETAGFNTFEDYSTLTTKDALVAEFGEENLKDDTAWYAEGTVMMLSTHLKDPNNGNRIIFLWEQDNPGQLSHIEAHASNWREENPTNQKVMSATGLYTGMPLTELVEWNGADISFSGFGWDYAGGVFADEGSKISECPVQITLNIKYEENDDHGDLYGDMELSSAAPEVQGAPIYIEMMAMYPKK